MKKILASFFGVLLFSNIADAKDGFYVGANYLQARSKHVYRIVYNAANYTQEGITTQDKSDGFAFDAGYKISMNEKLFFAPEIFYDYLNNKASDFFAEQQNAHSDRIHLYSRYGAKLNIGYNILPKFSLFTNAGLANLRYEVKWNSSGDSRADYKIAPVYGFGASYDLANNLALRVSYDRQKFNTQWIYEGLRSKVDLVVIKFGAVYSF